MLGGVGSAVSLPCNNGYDPAFLDDLSSPHSARRALEDGDDLTKEESFACGQLCAKLSSMQGV